MEAPAIIPSLVIKNPIATNVTAYEILCHRNDHCPYRLYFLQEEATKHKSTTGGCYGA